MAVGFGLSALIHVAVLGGLTFGGGVEVPSNDSLPPDNRSELAETALEVIRITAPVLGAFEAAAAAAPARSVAPSEILPSTGSAVMARLFDGADLTMPSDRSLSHSMVGMTMGSLAHVDGVSAEGLWDEYDEWAEGLVNRHVPDDHAVADWFTELQRASGPACGPTILINR